MTKINDGGPAFPTTYGQSPGMSLRDYVAALVLPSVAGVCANDTRRPGQSHPEMFAEKAFDIADAFLAARSGGQDDE